MELKRLVICYLKVQRPEKVIFHPPKASDLHPVLQKRFALFHLHMTSEIEIIISTGLITLKYDSITITYYQWDFCDTSDSFLVPSSPKFS